VEVDDQWKVTSSRGQGAAYGNRNFAANGMSPIITLFSEEQYLSSRGREA